MNDLGLVADAQAAIDATINGPSDQLALGIATAMRVACPDLPLYACGLVLDRGQRDAVAIDDAGHSRSDWSDALLPLIGPDAAPQTATRLDAIGLPNHRLLVEKMAFQQTHFGVLAVALEARCSAKNLSRWTAILHMLEGFATPRLYARGLREKHDELRNELHEEAQRAALGELAGPLAHEGNNFLNVVLLQAALMETEATESRRAQLETLRRQAAVFQALVREFHLSRRRTSSWGPTDLNRVLRAVLERNGVLPAGVSLAAGALPVRASMVDLKRLLSFLASGENEQSLPAGLGVRTEEAAGKVLCRLTIPREGAERVDPVETLETMACEGMARRMRAKLSEEVGTDGARIVVLEFAKAVD